MHDHIPDLERLGDQNQQNALQHTCTTPGCPSHGYLQEPLPLESLNDPWSNLVREISGRSFANEANVSHLVKKRVSRYATQNVKDFILSNLDPEFYATDEPSDKIARFLHSVTRVLRERPGIHIGRFIASLEEGRILRAESSNEANIAAAKKMLFIAVGWITNLYVPDLSRIDEPFAVNTEGATCFAASSADPDLDYRPVVEIVRKLGDILPTYHTHDSATSDVLNVASLNIATLIRVGHVRIDWTESWTSHLDFDTASLDPQTGTITPVLKLFRYPSFCYQYAPKETVLNRNVYPLPTYKSFLQGWYEEESFMTPKFTAHALMREILQSYKLLVLFDTRARKLFRRHIRDTSTLLDHDMELEALCFGLHHGVFTREYSKYRPPGLRETFQATADFPIFSSRLMKIERYIDSIQPNRVSALWRDRRDILRWYTFWAVFFLALVNFVFLLVQTVLAGEQVSLARESQT